MLVLLRPACPRGEALIGLVLPQLPSRKLPLHVGDVARGLGGLSWLNHRLPGWKGWRLICNFWNCVLPLIAQRLGIQRGFVYLFVLPCSFPRRVMSDGREWEQLQDWTQQISDVIKGMGTSDARPAALGNVAMHLGARPRILTKFGGLFEMFLC